jgi:hypothetical protein
MKKSRAIAAALFLLLGTAVTASAAIAGRYVEVRDADVYTGPCFANSQMGLMGKQAILAWKISHGSWHGTDLSGLGVMAVVKASNTLGDPYFNALPAKAVLIVDAHASAAQREALTGFARAMAPKLLEHIVQVDTAPISMKFDAEPGAVQVSAGKLAEIQTRALMACDMICGNEEVYYHPLVPETTAIPAFTVSEAFHGQGLGEVWTHHDQRSAFIGSFTY